MNCYVGNWLTPVILGLIAKKLKNFILPGLGTMYLLYLPLIGPALQLISFENWTIAFQNTASRD